MLARRIKCCKGGRVIFYVDYILRSCALQSPHLGPVTLHSHSHARPACFITSPSSPLHFNTFAFLLFCSLFFFFFFYFHARVTCRARTKLQRETVMHFISLSHQRHDTLVFSFIRLLLCSLLVLRSNRNCCYRRAELERYNKFPSCRLFVYNFPSSLSTIQITTTTTTTTIIIIIIIVVVVVIINFGAIGVLS
uniref:Uncharacterized protein n=1 Tax=Trypanosoma vivax (strain Y486) TaxID=1055687 RepID=G0UBW1_TRYVY|nr:hypothetical protein TVY486_1107930 [Trypanosoma vivax Y486]